VAIALPLATRRRRRIVSRAPAVIALIPAALIVFVVYVGCLAWTVRLSLSSSKLLPTLDFVGLAQYERLFANTRFLVSAQNLFIFGALFLILCLVLGFLLACFIDQKVRGEGIYRTIFLYPQAMSFIITGLVWQWFLNPTLGLQKLVRDGGWESFSFDWLVNRDFVIYTLVIAGVWHSSGLVMAILLAGLRGIDNDLWNATRVDGIPAWRVYLSIVRPILRPMVITATVLLATNVLRVYDLVVALTNGGPGISSEMPAKFVMDHLFNRSNVGLATACATMMLITVIIVLAPWLYSQYGPSRRGRPA
jgi:glucose/mannose transport system permease protein